MSSEIIMRQTHAEKISTKTAELKAKQYYIEALEDMEIKLIGESNK